MGAEVRGRGRAGAERRLEGGLRDVGLGYARNQEMGACPEPVRGVSSPPLGFESGGACAIGAQDGCTRVGGREGPMRVG